MSSEYKAVDKFGKLIVESLRDEAIKYYDGLAIGKWKAPALKKLQRDLAGFSEDQKEFIRRIVISTIDESLHNFLFAIQESTDLDKGVKIIVDGINIAKISDGLHGESFSKIKN